MQKKIKLWWFYANFCTCARFIDATVWYMSAKLNFQGQSSDMDMEVGLKKIFMKYYITHKKE